VIVSLRRYQLTPLPPRNANQRTIE